MAADEEKPEHVVAVRRFVETLGDARFRIVEIGNRFVAGQRRLAGASAGPVERGVAANEDEPRRWVARRSVLRPVLQCPEAGFLERLLRRVEIAEIAQQRADRLWPGGGQCRIDPGGV